MSCFFKGSWRSQWSQMGLIVVCTFLTGRPGLAEEAQLLEVFEPNYFQEQNLRAADLGIGKNKLVLTFDDGPTPHTIRLLKALIAYQMPATFFIVDISVKNNPVAAQQAFALMKQHPDLFRLANHSANHIKLTAKTMGPTQWINELFKVHNDTIIPFHGPAAEPLVAYYYFRAPFGSFNWKISRFYNEINIPDRRLAVQRYIGPIFWDMGGFYQTIQGKSVYVGDWTCWSKAFNYSVETCREGHWAELQKFIGINSNRTSGVILLAHDLHKKSVQMFVGSSEFDEQGNMIKEDPQSLLARLHQLKLRSIGEQWPAPFNVVGIDDNKTRTLFVRDFLPGLNKLPNWNVQE